MSNRARLVKAVVQALPNVSLRGRHAAVRYMKLRRPARAVWPHVDTKKKNQEKEPRKEAINHGI
jgi:hypothetical protein